MTEKWGSTATEYDFGKAENACMLYRPLEMSMNYNWCSHSAERERPHRMEEHEYPYVSPLHSPRE